MKSVIGINPRYLVEAIEVVETKNVVIEVNDSELGPIVVKPKPEGQILLGLDAASKPPSTLEVVMPMRMSDNW